MCGGTVQRHEHSLCSSYVYCVSLLPVIGWGAKVRNCIYIYIYVCACGQVTDSKTLGEWCGLVRRDPKGTVTKVVNCSSCAVLAHGMDRAARETKIVLTHIKANKDTKKGGKK